jgi:acyl-CoA reductase-like NAD-dependent aldehyde dehydrogenase
MGSTLSQQDIQDIIERVRRRLGEAGPTGAGLRGAAEVSASAEAELGDGIFPTIDEAVEAAREAFEEYRGVGLGGRKTIIAAIRSSMLEHNERLAEMAHAETGLGRVADKIVKNRLVSTKAPGPEDLEVEASTGELGMMVTEFAPFGVVGSITPTTNPTSTIINNTISILSAGNSLVFNVHPNAK